jgi:hypothetical protein
MLRTASLARKVWKEQRPPNCIGHVLRQNGPPAGGKRNRRRWSLQGEAGTQGHRLPRSFPRAYPAVLRSAHQHTYARHHPASALTLAHIRWSCCRSAFACTVPSTALGAHDLPSGSSVFGRSPRPVPSTPHSSAAASHSPETHSRSIVLNIGHELTDSTAWAHHERASPGEEEHITDSSRRPPRHCTGERYVAHSLAMPLISPEDKHPQSHFALP